MKLVIGLGNPGPQYETTRHNAGFLMLDLIADHFGISWDGKKFDGLSAKGSIHGESVLLLKPMTFMNLSGKSVSQAMRFFKIPSSDVVVLHDEIDLAHGKVKARVGGGAGGHNGIRSLIKETGQSEFHRIKLGVGKPATEGHAGIGVSQWVLNPFSDEQLLELQQGMLEATLVRLKSIFQGM